MNDYPMDPAALQTSFTFVYRFVTENMTLLSTYISAATVDWVCVMTVHGHEINELTEFCRP